MLIEQRLEFLDSLPNLPQTNKGRIRAFADQVPVNPGETKGNGSGAMSEQTFNLYVPGMAEQNKKDVNNCRLLVQNAATQKYDPNTQMKQWYTHYTETMSKLGWIIQASQTRDQVIKQSGLTMDAVAVYVLQGLVGANFPTLAAVAKNAVEAVKNNDGLIDLYNRKSHVGSDEKFDISPAWETTEGYPMMIMNCSSLDVRESSRGILFWKSTSQETKIVTAAHAMYLNLEVYSQIRNDVLKKIGNAAKGALEELPDL